MSRQLISVKNLSVEFGGDVVLEKVSFNVDDGDILAIIGPNGAGKTVLLRTILGLNRNFRGQITWHRQPGVSYVPQRINFEREFPLTVREFFLLETEKTFSFWLPPQRHLEEIKNQLRGVGALHLLDSRLGDLSHGQLQRVLIAHSLLENPGVVFFDEPAAGIDVGTEETVYNLLYDLHQKNKFTMILVSHELNVVYRFATKIICLNKSLVCQGVPADVLTPTNLKELFGHHTAFYKHEHNLDHHGRH